MRPRRKSDIERATRTRIIESSGERARSLAREIETREQRKRRKEGKEIDVLEVRDCYLLPVKRNFLRRSYGASRANERAREDNAIDASSGAFICRW